MCSKLQKDSFLLWYIDIFEILSRLLMDLPIWEFMIHQHNINLMLIYKQIFNVYFMSVMYLQICMCILRFAWCYLEHCAIGSFSSKEFLKIKVGHISIYHVTCKSQFNLVNSIKIKLQPFCRKHFYFSYEYEKLKIEK